MRAKMEAAVDRTAVRAVAEFETEPFNSLSWRRSCAFGLHGLGRRGVHTVARSHEADWSEAGHARLG